MANAEKPKKGGLKSFFKGVWNELKKVHWPSKKQIVTYTGVVLLTCAAMAAVISVFDWVVSSIINFLLTV